MARLHSSVGEAFLREVVVASARGVVAVDDGGTVVFANRTVGRLLGHDPEALVGERVDRLLPDDAASPFEPTADGADPADGGGTVTDRLADLVHADGDTVRVALAVEETTFDGRPYVTATVRPVDGDRPGTAGGSGSPAGATPLEPGRDLAVGEGRRTGVESATGDGHATGGDATADGSATSDAGATGDPGATEDGRTTCDGPAAEGPRPLGAGTAAVGDRATAAGVDEGPFETIFRHANDAMLVVDPETGAIVDANRRATEVLGYDREELLDASPADLHPDETEAVHEFVERVVADGSGWTDAVTCHTADGEAFPAEVSASRVELGGEPHVLALVRDVSDRLRRDQRIRRQAAAMEATSDGMAILDEDGRYVSVNDAHCRLYGHDDPDELVGDSWRRLYDDEQRERFEEEILPVVRSEGEWTGEVVGRRSDGTEFPQRLTLTELDDGGLVYAVRDVTEQKTYVGKLEALNEASRRLMAADATDEIASHAVETVEDVLGFDVACVRLFDSEPNALEPVAMTEAARELVETCPAFDLEASLAGRAYRQGRRVEGVVEDDDRALEWRVRGHVHLPLGECGTLSVFTSAPSFEAVDCHHLELLAANVATAIQRTEHENRLRQNERDLRQQHAELETLNQITTLVSELVQQLVEKTTREEIYRTVCDRLADSGFYESAWIGTVEAGDRKIRPVAGSGLADGYLEALATLPVSSLAHSGVEKALDEGRIRVVHQYVREATGGRAAGSGRGSGDEGAAGDDEVTGGGRPADSGRDTGEPAAGGGPPTGGDPEAGGDQVAGATIAAVPLQYGDRTHGVLVVDAEREDVFSETARTGLEVLGDVVGFVLTAALNRELLHADAVVELEFEVTDSRFLPVAFSEELGCRTELEKITPLGDGHFLVYLQIEGATVEDALAVADGIEGVADHRVVGEHDEGLLLELTSTTTVIPTLIEMGASAPTLVVEDGRGRLTVEVSPATDIREMVESLREMYPRSELVKKRELDRPVRTTAEFREELNDRLTEKQRQAIETAYVVGFYDWPRQQNAEEIASSLGVSAPTFHQHLRKAEQKLVEAFFEESEAA